MMHVARIIDFSRTHGWKKGLYRLCYGLSQRSFGRFVGCTIAELMAAPVATLRQLERLPKSLQVRILEPAQLSQLDHLIGHPGKAARRYSAGDQCLVALSGGEVLATEWIKFGPSTYEEDREDLGVTFRIPTNACWLYGGKTVNAEQVIGPWGAVMGRVRAYLETQGVEVAYLQVGYHNQYSIRCHKEFGFRTIGRLRCVRLGSWRMVHYCSTNGAWTAVRDSEYYLERLFTNQLEFRADSP